VIVDGQATKNADQNKVVQALVKQLLERKEDVEPVTKDATCRVLRRQSTIRGGWTRSCAQSIKSWNWTK